MNTECLFLPCAKEGVRSEGLYPGYLLSQDTFMVGTIKGVGRVYLQAFVDTYGSYAFGKLYTSKLPGTAADVLYDKVLPFYEEHGLTAENILTDNGREYCGRQMIHPFRYSWGSRTSNIEERRWRTPGSTALRSGSTGRSSTSSSGRHSVPTSASPSMNSRQISTYGLRPTTTSAPPGIPQHGTEVYRDHRGKEEGESTDERTGGIASMRGRGAGCPERG